ncbi:MAG: bifunctional DNA-formamidopyrimidine glycosylase/DNA-(apurinic or apyrimidinic site) lyase [Bryobacter sp.]|nr:bifunctional DNA-formamidopyrimidine glycosylase/DNA-(apurinic or apyrimidinic site) lyase [Bryobacter sp.]
MPELPEVETVVRGLREVLPGQRVEAVENVDARVVGKEIVGVRRHGKFIGLVFGDGLLLVHLGMTGQLTLSEGTGKFTRARLMLSGGVLRFDDIRKFGRMYWDTDWPERGPDPLEMSTAEFVERAKGRRARVKALLLDQRFLRGVGNIYADESLFRAGLHPLAVAARVSRKRLAGLHGALVEVLEEAIRAGGSSISDYVDARGERGSFQERHQVYGKAGKACPRCGAELKRMLVAQRGTTYCGGCQGR